MSEYNIKLIKDDFIKNCQLFIEEDVPIITILANISRLLIDSFPNTSWAGFYLSFDNETLYLGPYQGDIACTIIKFGKGVCGTSAKLKKTQLVPNVHEYPGHIACSSTTNSEIVVPICNDNKVFGVIDLDSDEFNNYSTEDQMILEDLAFLLANKF